MAGKKKRKKQPTLRSRIVSLIIERGPMKLGVMVRTLKASYQSLNTEALELRRLGVLQKGAEGVWSLVHGVNPAMFGIEIITSDQGGRVSTEASVSTTPTPPQFESSRTFKDEFIDLLKSVGVRKAAETIADLFFNGEDIWDMRWLHRVLSDYARGFVTEAQCKLIMGYWAHTKGIPYKYEDFFKD